MKNDFSYDVMPYSNSFFSQTHPNHLASLATFFGMNPANIETCRVLELGCGNGNNLISHSYNLPEAKFVGVDLAKNHILFAQKAAKALDLQNVEFHQMDVMEMSVENFGKFDYIIAHGFFSWIPDFARDKMLSLYREMLEPNGVGYISYNAFPGAHYRQMVRNIMLFHTRRFDEPMEKVGKAIAFLGFLSENTTRDEVFNNILNDELQRNLRRDMNIILHDDLSPNNQPFYFHEFAELLNNNNLQYLAEAEISMMGTQNLSPDARQFIESLDDIVEREQHLDFVRGRLFRQTLVCHREIELNRHPEPFVMNKFMLASAIRPALVSPELTAKKVEEFVGLKGGSVNIDHPLTKAALVHLGEIWGRAVSFGELLKTAKEMLEKQGFSADNWDEEFHISSALLQQICSGARIIELYLFQPKAFLEVSEKPRVNDLARWQILQGKRVLSLLNLEINIADAVSRHLLKLLDGTRNKADLSGQLTEFIEANEDIKDKEFLLNDLSNWLDDSLANLARCGLFAA